MVFLWGLECQGTRTALKTQFLSTVLQPVVEKKKQPTDSSHCNVLASANRFLITHNPCKLGKKQNQTTQHTTVVPRTCWRPFQTYSDRPVGRKTLIHTICWVSNCWCQVLHHKQKNVSCFAVTQTKAALQSRPRILMNDNSWCNGGVHSNRSVGFFFLNTIKEIQSGELIWAVNRKGPNYEILHV